MSEQLATIEPAQTAPTVQPAGEGAALISMIERAARDPNVDIDKMERLFQMHERAEEKRARAAFDAAFAAMQIEMPEVDKRGKITIKVKDSEKVIQSTLYALWDDINRLIKPILTKYGFGLSFRITQTESRIITTAVLSHTAGHREETQFSAAIDATGSKNNVQGWGSSFSYGKRYTGTAILNITTKGEDDDGKAAGTALITDEQSDELRALIAKTSTKIDEFLKFAGVESLSDVQAGQFGKAKALLVAKLNKMKGNRNG